MKGNPMNMTRMSRADVKVRPYAERSTAELSYIRAVLNQQGNPVPVDLNAALIERGIVLDN